MELKPTARELDVLNLICEGYSTKQIAYRLGISFKTALTHRYHLMEKAGVDNVIQLFRWAIQEGYVTIEMRRPPRRTFSLQQESNMSV